MRDLVVVLRDAAYDIERDVYARYNWPDVHPAMQRKFDRDIAIVVELRAHAAAADLP